MYLNSICFKVCWQDCVCYSRLLQFYSVSLADLLAAATNSGKLGLCGKSTLSLNKTVLT